MKFKDYIPLALRTESTGPSAEAFIADLKHRRVLHAAIGLCTEAGELMLAVSVDDTVNVSEETGDLGWYLAILADIYGFDFTDIEREEIHICDSVQTARNLAIAASEILNECKRALFYGKDMDLNAIKTQCRNIYRWCRWLGHDDFLAVNIAKLQKRYPAKFTAEKAVNRDLVSERKVLEGK